MSYFHQMAQRALVLSFGLIGLFATATGFSHGAAAQEGKFRLGPELITKLGPEIAGRAAGPIPTPTPFDDAMSALQGRGRTLEIDPRILGGLPAPVGAYPWLVSIEVAGKPSLEAHFCGGSLISPNWVVTAAHCIRPTTRASDIEVLVGTNFLSSGGKKFAVEKVVVHPSWDRPSFRNDAALLKLVQNVPNAVPIELLAADIAESAAEPGALATVAGWGLVREGGAVSNVLRHVGVQIISNTVCNGPQAYGGVIGPEMFCAGFIEGGRDSCQGDSGGPIMVVNGRGGFALAGLVSWGEGCGRPNKYGVYTRLWLFNAWANQVRSNP